MKNLHNIEKALPYRTYEYLGWDGMGKKWHISKTTRSDGRWIARYADNDAELYVNYPIVAMTLTQLSKTLEGLSIGGVKKP